MLNSHEILYSSDYQYLNGALNVCFLAGILRRPGKTQFFVQQTNNPNQFLPVELPKEGLPPQYKEFDPIKVIGRVQGYVDDDGTYAIRIRAMHFQRPNVLDMPPERNFRIKIPQGVKEDNFKPRQYGYEFSGNANSVKIAGILVGTFIEPQNEFQDASKKTLVLLIQQSADPAKVIPLKFRARNADAVRERLRVGVGLFCEANFVAKANILGEPDEDGVQPVRIVPMLRTQIPNPAVIGEHIKWTVEPEWLTDFYSDLEQKAEERKSRRERAIGDPLQAATADVDAANDQEVPPAAASGFSDL